MAEHGNHIHVDLASGGMIYGDWTRVRIGEGSHGDIVVLLPSAC